MSSMNVGSDGLEGKELETIVGQSVEAGEQRAHQAAEADLKADELKAEHHETAHHTVEDHTVEHHPSQHYGRADDHALETLMEKTVAAESLGAQQHDRADDPAVDPIFGVHVAEKSDPDEGYLPIDPSTAHVVDLGTEHQEAAQSMDYGFPGDDGYGEYTGAE